MHKLRLFIITAAMLATATAVGMLAHMLVNSAPQSSNNSSRTIDSATVDDPAQTDVDQQQASTAPYRQQEEPIPNGTINFDAFLEILKRAPTNLVIQPPPTTTTSETGQAKLTEAGKVIFSRGRAKATQDKEGAGDQVTRELTISSIILLKDTITTEKATKLQIQMLDGSVIWICEDSGVVIEQFVQDDDIPENAYSIRLTKGQCMITTPANSELDVNRLNIRTHLAITTVGECQVLVKTTENSDLIYVLKLPINKTLNVDTTINGAIIMDPITGKPMPVEDKERTQLVVEEENIVIEIIKGNRVDTDTVDEKEVAGLIHCIADPFANRFTLMEIAGKYVMVKRAPDIPSVYVDRPDGVQIAIDEFTVAYVTPGKNDDSTSFNVTIPGTSDPTRPTGTTYEETPGVVTEVATEEDDHATTTRTTKRDEANTGDDDDDDVIVIPPPPPIPSVTLSFAPAIINYGNSSTMTASPTSGSGIYTAYEYQYDNHPIWNPSWNASALTALTTNTWTTNWQHYIRYRVRVRDSNNNWSGWDEAFLNVTNLPYPPTPPFQSTSGTL